MSIVTFANLIHEIQNALAAMPKHGQLNIEDLQIDVHGEDSNLAVWIDMAFGFATNQPNDDEPRTPPAEKFTVSAMASDAWLTAIIELNDSDEFPSQVFMRRFDTFRRIQVSDRLTIDYFPQIGAAWVTNRETNQVGLIHSSRTSFPNLEIRTGLIDIINRHLESRGWHTFHSAAVIYEGRAALIVGDSGAGKTTLLANLLSLNATYIANERLFVKQADDDTIHLRSFPQTIGIGLGTAMQLTELTPFIHRPDRLTYYQKAFEPQRVYTTPVEQWPQLPDKLKFLPSELAAAFGAPSPRAFAKADAILLPKITPHQPTSSERVEPEDAFEVLARNYFAAENDHLYPRWLPIRYDYRAQIDQVAVTSALSKLPVHRLTYFVDNASTDSKQLLIEQLNCALD